MNAQLTENIEMFTNADNISIQRVYLVYGADPRTVSDAEIAEAQRVAEAHLGVRFYGFVRPFCDNRQTLAYWQ